MHWVVHSTKGVIVLIVVLLPNSELTKGNNKPDADTHNSFTMAGVGGGSSLNSQ